MAARGLTKERAGDRASAGMGVWRSRLVPAACAGGLMLLTPVPAALAQSDNADWVRSAIGKPSSADTAPPARLQPSRQSSSSGGSRSSSSGTSRITTSSTRPPAKPSSKEPTFTPPPEPTVVPFVAPYPPYSVVIVNSERALYFVGDDNNAIRYPIAVGTKWELWTGKEVVTKKRKNPAWIPEEGDEPVPGGDPENPLGARALYLGQTMWRIHGTIKPRSIGQAASGGCFRMLNEHVIDLYDRVPVGTEVFVVNAIMDKPPRRRGRKVEDD